MAIPDNSKNTSRIILVVVGILVLSALAYFGIKYFAAKAENEQNIAKIEDLKNEMMELEEKILDFQSTLEDKNMEIADKDKLLEEKERQIQDYIDRLAVAKKQGRTKDKRIQELEARVQSLQRYVESYKTQIAELEAQNQELSIQVDTLRTQTTRLRAENRDLAATNESTSKQLEETIKIASVLKAREFSFYQVNKRGKEKAGTEFRRGQLKEIKVCFNLQENLIADPGEREVYVVLENPDGSPNANFTDGYSGKFTFEDQEKVYSAKVTVNYNRLEQQVCVPFKIADENKFEKGPQYVSVYSDGNLIGQSAFKVK
ncbi:MAG: hypothetical protein D6730_14255 [Bacteroidetes bacterium]|nr:MAG: hypothetical protein D6730_14255 [Bacteroidota bacterium]